MRYTKTHEWAKKIDATIIRIGISAYGVGELGTIEFVDLPPIGTQLLQGKPFAQIESTKVSSDLYAPLDGEVQAINDAVVEDIHLLNAEPEGTGWLIDIRVSSLDTFSRLMSAAEYTTYTTGDAG